MLTILLAQIEDAACRRLAEGIRRRTDADVLVAATAKETLERIAAAPEGLAALVIGAVPEAIHIIQRAHAIDPGLSVVLLPADGAAPDRREQLRLTPYLGEDVTCLDSAGPDSFADTIVEAAERRRLRQAYERTMATMNTRFDQTTRPRQAANHLGRLLNQAPVGVVTVDEEGRVHGLNHYARALFDRPEHELVGESLPLLFASPEREGVREQLTRAIRQPAVSAETFDRSRTAGRPQHLEMSVLAVEVAPDQPGAIVLLQDVTEREQALEQRDRTEDALRQQRRWFEATLLSIGDAVIATDSHGHVTFMNAVAEELTGWPLSKAAGRASDQVFRIVNESTREPVESPVTRVMREGVIVGLANHTVLVSRDGREYPIDDSGAPIRDAGGKIAGVVLVFRDFSDRRRTEHELQESERRFRTIFDQAAAGIALVSPDRRILQVNERFCHIVGYSRDELLAMDDPVAMLTHPGDAIVDPRSARPAHDPPVQIEKRYIHKEGHPVWVRLSASALRDEQGRLLQMIAVVEDIDERKRAEEALQASEDRLRQILESLTNYAIFSMDLQGRVTSWNAGAERVLGYTESEILGQPGHIIFLEEDRQAGIADAEFRAARHKGQASDDRWHVRKDGSVFWASGLLTTLGPSGDAPQGFVKILRDQTDAKNVRDQLEARSRERAALAQFGQRALSASGLQALFDEAVETIAQTLDMELCKILRLLPGGHELQLEAGTGWQAELVGRARVGADRQSQAGYTLLSEDPVVVDDLRTETRFSGPPLLHEAGVISGMSVVIAGTNGRPWGVLGAHSRRHRKLTANDVNFLQAMANILATAVQRDRSLQELQALNESLEQRVAERTAEAEHRAAQLRALTSELTRTEQRERRRLAQVLHDNLQQMLVASKLQLGSLPETLSDERAARALRRVSDLLDDSIRESRSLTLELSPPVLYEAGLVAGLEWLGRWFEEQHGLTVELSADEGADPAGDDLRVVLFQAARELLFNVVKHSGAAKAELALHRDSAERIELTVSDRGTGFDPEAAGRVDANQAGFGLFSIRERLAWLGGGLDIRSAPAQGTGATVVVPEAADHAAAMPTPQARPAPADPTAASATPRPQPVDQPQSRVVRVVLADDHRILREGLVGVLGTEPDIIVVGEAGDGQEALDLVRRTHPDAVVLDVTMPRMNGVEAARAITAEFPDIRVIGLSVHETADMAEAMRKAGAAEYLNKAEASERLLAAIRGSNTA